MGQNNKRLNGAPGPTNVSANSMNGGAGGHMNGHMHSMNTSGFSNQQVAQNQMSYQHTDHNNGFQFEQNSQSNMIYSSDSHKVTLDDFELLKVIGQGNFAKVMQVR